MNVQTAQSDEIDAQNYGLIALKHRIFKRSSLGGIFVNRQNTSSSEDYNRVLGTQFDFSTEKGIVSGSAMYFKSYSDGLKGNNDFTSSSLFINKRSYRLFFRADHVGENYLTDTGFNPRIFNYDASRDTTIRVNYQSYNAFGAIDFRPEKSKMVFHGPRFQNILYTNGGDQFNERYTYIGYEIDFANQSEFDAGIQNYSVNLLFPTDFLGEGEALPAKDL